MVVCPKNIPNLESIATLGRHSFLHATKQFFDGYGVTHVRGRSGSPSAQKGGRRMVQAAGYQAGGGSQHIQSQAGCRKRNLCEDPSRSRLVLRRGPQSSQSRREAPLAIGADVCKPVRPLPHDRAETCA